jgi:hypothetical protein
MIRSPAAKSRPAWVLPHLMDVQGFEKYGRSLGFFRPEIMGKRDIFRPEIKRALL